MQRQRNPVGGFLVSWSRSGASTKRILSLAVGSLFLLNTIGVRGEDKPVRTISVSGTVETKVAPDQILWQISLAATDPNLSKAKERSDEQVKSVVALREKLGIGEGDFQTGPVSVNREYERGPMGNRGNFKHFAVSRSISIRQRDLKRFDEYLDTLVSSTEMEVYFNLESSRMQEIRSESRLKALHAAKEKAAAMAEALGAKLSKVLTINEHSVSEPGRTPMSNGNFVQSTPPADVATPTFVPGAISVPVTVYVTFELD